MLGRCWNSRFASYVGPRQTVTAMNMRKASLLHPKLHRERRSPKDLRELEKARRFWLEGLEPTALFQRLFDHIPGVFFFAKDAKGRTMFASRGILDLYQMKDESEMLGLTDFDLNPAVMAVNYVRDDQSLLSGKVNQLERMELWFDRMGMPDWFLVTKLPILDAARKPQGVMGILRRASDNEKQLPVFQTVAKAVEIIRRDYGSALTIGEVAQACGQSLRQLQRHFQSAFACTPQEFLLRTRILAATRLLEETRLTAAEIALQCGFFDASSFTQHFRVRTGETPVAYRQACVTQGARSA